ncbi:uncharacterized protein I303_100621 [Kwoniella dejecticola CBS 10117]|uniref:FAS1 domain-containing protein n=1 Tax=Kwoniella dejecticola CBS 10117 TaxID=1296121 RepID=A0A1A6AFF4_9TREE|nr:uncharacterized protein I303_00624 [Kwoniella dejecticola CBS 10117]OBR88807.1 hypothetical protein I303_00624 [Kwoniella dejecticola CBS 10117]
MRFSSLLLLPLATALPAKPSIPELTVNQWNSIQSGFTDNLRSLSSWSWNKAEDVIDELEAIAGVNSESNNDNSDLTIWQALKADPHSFSKLVKIIEFEGKAIDYLDDKDLQITFFAPNNDALTPPEHRHHHHDGDHDSLAELLHNPSLQTLSNALEAEPSLLAEDEDHKHHGHHGDDDDPEKKKRRKEIFRKIAGKVLQYHGLTKAYTAQELAQNSTIATALKAEDGSFGGLHRRIRIDKHFVPPSLKINFYAKVYAADNKARNGYFHSIDHPLIPPGSLIDELFLFPDVFSTLTSSVQKVHGREYLDWHYDREHSKPGKPQFHGKPLVTLFAPTNIAFATIPPKLKFYLFSPFGEHALTKLLAYHYIPNTLLLSELLYTQKEKRSEVDSFADDLGEYTYFTYSLADDPSFHKELEIAPALPNSTLKIEIDKTKFLPVEGAIKTTIKVNGQEVKVIDVPARNGASHVIDHLLIPPHHHHDHHGKDVAHLDTWSNWEEWFPTWAAQ